MKVSSVLAMEVSPLTVSWTSSAATELKRDRKKIKREDSNNNLNSAIAWYELNRVESSSEKEWFVFI